MKRLSVFALAALLCVSAAPAAAGPIVVDAGWYGFCFGEAGSPAVAGCKNLGIGTTGNPFTFTAVAPVRLKVTDAFDYGDVFSVFIDGMPFTTPFVAAGRATTADPDLAFADPNYSHAAWLLGAGSHSVEVFALESPWNGGGAYLEVETPAVPEPGSMLLLGTGLVGLGRAWKKRRG